MAIASVTGITVKIGADTKELREELGKVGATVETELKPAEKPVENLKKNLFDSAKNAAMLAAACTIIGKATGSFVKGAIEDAVKVSPETQEVWNNMKQAFDDLKRTIGESLLPAIQDLAPKITEVVNNVSTFFKEHPEAAQIILGIAAAIALVASVLGPLIPVLVLAGVSIGAIAAPVLIVVGVLALLIAGFIMIKTHWEEIKVFFDELGDNIREKFDGMKEKFGELGEKVEESKTKFGEWKESLKEKISTVWSSITDAIKEIDLVQIGRDFVNSIKTGIENGIDAAKDHIKSLFLSLVPNWAKNLFHIGVDDGGDIDGQRAGGGPVSKDKTYLVGENGPELFTPGAAGDIIPNDALSSGLSAGASTMLGGSSTWIPASGGPVRSGGGDNSVLNLSPEMINAITAAFERLKTVLDAVKAAMEAIANYAPVFVTAAQTVIDITARTSLNDKGEVEAGSGNTLYTALGAVKGVFEDILTVTRQIVEEWLGPYAEAVETMKKSSNIATEVLENLASGAANARDTFNGLADSINAALGALQGLDAYLRGGSPGAGLGGLLPFGGGHAEGGPVHAGVSYLVGENGPELYTPHRNGYIVPNDELSGSRSTTVNVIFEREVYGDERSLRNIVKTAVRNGIREEVRSAA